MMISSNESSIRLTPEELMEKFMMECRNYREQVSDGDEMIDSNGFIMILYRRVLNMFPEWDFAQKVKSLLVSSLSLNAKATFFALIEFFYDNFTTPAGEKDFHGLSVIAFFEGIPELVNHRLAVSVAVHDEDNSKTSNKFYLITKEVANLLFKGKDELIRGSVLTQFGSFTLAGDIEEKKLFFPDSLQKDLARITKITSAKLYDEFRQELRINGVRAGVAMIFYGPPGTGKTEYARQVARQTERNMLIVDYSKLGGTYYGETPRQLRDLFRAFSYCSALSSLHPILLIDEADALLSERVTITRAADKESNAVSNILLEEMNTFSGILIATTNHIESIDSALFRRFLIKLAFPVPDLATRIKIWRSKIPWLGKAAAKRLAEEADLSGGYIDNVVSLCIMERVLTGKKPSLSFILHLVEGQQVGKTKKQPKIGF